MKKELLWFLALTFGITYALNFLAFRQFGMIGEGADPRWGQYLAFQMLIPAGVSLLLMIAFKKTFTRLLKIFWGIYAAILAIITISLFYDPILFSSEQDGQTVNVTFSMLAVQAVSFIGALFLIITNIKKKWREKLTLHQLSVGESPKYYLIGLAFLLLPLISSVFINRALGMGEPAQNFNLQSFALTSLLALTLAPLSSWPFFLGEEFGWRVFLQDRLFALFGNFKGVLILGVIWGLWHAPVIALGYNYPGQPVIGVILMTILTVLIGIVHSWVVIKTKSVWPAVWIHLAMNNMITLGYVYISQPRDPIFSFGIGIYGLALMALPMLYLLFTQKEFMSAK
jgi:uncharacterized protein